MAGVEVIVETSGGSRVVVTPLLEDSRAAAPQGPISAAYRRQALGERPSDALLRRLGRHRLAPSRPALGY